MTVPVPDVYFTAGYGRAAAQMEDGTWNEYSWRDAALVPYVLRRLESGGGDAISPYGYSGIHLAPGHSDADVTLFWKSTLEHWRERDVVSVFLRFSPFDLASVRAVSELSGLTLTRRGDTVLIRVDSGPQALWSNLDSSARNKVRKAERAGLSARVRPVERADIAPGSPYRALYSQTMTRVGAAGKYCFGDEYFEALGRGVGPDLWFAEARDAEGEIAAAALLLTHDDRVHYHLGASGPRGLRLGANNLMVWGFLCWAAERGSRFVHLGGGVSTDDSLFHFKSGFGGRRAQFWTGNVIVDPSRYRELVAVRAQMLGCRSEELLTGGHFPAYRGELAS